MGTTLLLRATLLLCVLFSPSLCDTLSDRRGVRSDVKYILCDACTHASKQATKLTNELPSTLIETDTLDIIESLCLPDSPQGNWLRTLDMIEDFSSRTISLKSYAPKQQTCKQECKTISLACEEAVDGRESELAEFLYALKKKEGEGVKEGDVDRWLCGHVCESGNVNKFGKERKEGPLFKQLDEKEELQAKMKEFAAQSGQNMNMFSKDDMKNMPGMNADEDEDDDDEDLPEDMKQKEDDDMPDDDDSSSSDEL